MARGDGRRLRRVFAAFLDRPAGFGVPFLAVVAFFAVVDLPALSPD
jgi:hypothetical protein